MENRYYKRLGGRMIQSTTTIRTNNEPIKREVKPYGNGYRVYFHPLIEKTHKIILLDDKTKYSIHKSFNEDKTIYSFEIDGEYYVFNETSKANTKTNYINIPRKYMDWICYSIEI